MTKLQQAEQNYYKELLNSFTKANSGRKAAIAKENGKNVEDYKMYLQKKAGVGSGTPKKVTDRVKSPAKTTTPANVPSSTQTVVMTAEDLKTILSTPTTPQVKPTIHNVHILDASGSMSGAKFFNALKGINDEIAELKKDGGVNYTQTTVSFSGMNEVIRFSFLEPIEYVSPVYDSTKGSTALYNTVGIILTELLGHANGIDKYLVKIFTDGGDNDGPYTFRSQGVLAKLIKDAEAKGFTITFVGTAIDVATVTRFLQLTEGNTLVHDNTAIGIQRSYMESLGATRSYSKKVVAGEDVLSGFYTKKVGVL